MHDVGYALEVVVGIVKFVLTHGFVMCGVNEPTILFFSTVSSDCERLIIMPVTG